MNLDKKNKELICLNRVIKTNKLLYGESKRIINKISGDEFARPNTESPDFVKFFPPISKYERGTLIGIEHFRVDQLSLKKRDGNVASSGILTEKKVYEIYQQWHEEVTTSDIIPDGAVRDIANLIAQQIQKVNKSSYNTFIKAFEYSLIKHLENINLYRANLRKLSAGNYKTELALLIEIHTEFSNLFLNDEKGTYRQGNDFIPIFEDMVHLLEEKVNCHKVNYIILCLGGTLYDDNIKVIAVKTNNIRKQLQKQKVIIYEYAGEDLIYEDFQSNQRKIIAEPNYFIDNDKISIGIEYKDKEQNEQFILNAIFYSLRKALEYRQQGKYFVTTFGTQMMLDILGDYIIGWNNIGNTNIVDPIFLPLVKDDVLHKWVEFERKFPEKKPYSNE